MAKQQSFGDKLKKKEVDSKINVKVIHWFHDPNRDNALRARTEFVKVDDITQVEKIEVNN